MASPIGKQESRPAAMVQTLKRRQPSDAYNGTRSWSDSGACAKQRCITSPQQEPFSVARLARGTVCALRPTCKVQDQDQLHRPHSNDKYCTSRARREEPGKSVKSAFNTTPEEQQFSEVGAAHPASQTRRATSTRLMTGSSESCPAHLWQRIWRSDT